MVDDFARSGEELHALLGALQSGVFGQQEAVTEVVCALASGGHVLLEGMPGLGKTRLAKCVGSATGLRLGRVQCTPDLLPGDVTGVELPGPDGVLAFRPGPVFAPLVLVDEINRATPRTQAAFLEAMAECQVSYLGTTRALPEGFRVIATQNPVELDGTFPLPEAQLDRFAVKTLLPWPDADALNVLARDAREEDAFPEVVVDADVFVRSVNAVREVVAADAVRQAAIDLLTALQPALPAAHALVSAHVHYGPGPRALLDLIRSAAAHALLAGRAHLAVTDLRRIAIPTLRHRLRLGFDAAFAGPDIESLLAEVVSDTLP